MSAKILVVGGAGYIGSHMVKCLLDHGHRITVLDDLSNGRRDLVLSEDFVQGDIADRNLVRDILKSRNIDAVMHFAAFIDVRESVTNPERYYDNNVARTVTLLNSMLECGVQRLIFSSSCAVYGTPQSVPLREDMPRQPVNPYGESKYFVERILESYEAAHGLKSYRLRYFNAAGADPEGRLGECHNPETHLIPLAIRAALGRIPQLQVFGDNYDTPDGTCIRDYVHVSDLCEAHRLALLDLLKGGTGGALNVGIGRGYSVREVIAAVEKITGKTVKVQMAARRDGDVRCLVADPSRIRARLGWEPKLTSIETMVAHAAAWEQKQSSTA